MTKPKNPQLRAKPLSPPSPTTMEEFIMGAEKPKNSSISMGSFLNETILPWEHSSVREDVLKTFNLRLPETYFKKLEYLSQVKKESKHKICLDILLPALDAKLNIK